MLDRNENECMEVQRCGMKRLKGGESKVEGKRKDEGKHDNVAEK